MATTTDTTTVIEIQKACLDIRGSVAARFHAIGDSLF